MRHQILSVSAVILAGGKGRRMGGVDKGLQLLYGQPLFLHVAQRLQLQVESVAINANRHHDEYAQAGYAVFGDELVDYQGPLSGILTALSRTQSDYLLFVPCDSPFFPMDLLERLSKPCQRANALISYAHDGERAHPTFCLVSRKVLEPLRQYLASGERRLLQFFESQNAVAVDFHDVAKAFVNLNTLNDLQAQNARSEYF